MRADRLVSTLLWLQVHGQTSAAELARRQEVSPRTIHRDMEALSAAGIPVFALRGRNGGWALPAEYRLSSKWLSAEEVRALAVLTPAPVLADLGLAGTADAAWLKLLAALPRPHRDAATFVHQRIHVDTSTWQPRRETLPCLPALKEAVFTEQQVKLRYRRDSGDVVVRHIAPLGLVAKGQSWYVVGAIEGDIRSYRISRIEAVDILPERVERPAGFDLASFWEASKQRLADGLPRYPVSLLVDSSAIEEVRRGVRWGRMVQVAAPEADGRRLVTIIFEIFPDALASVLSFGDRAEVVTPDELRAAVCHSLRATLARYAPPGHTQPLHEHDSPEDDTSGSLRHDALTPSYGDDVVPFGATTIERPRGTVRRATQRDGTDGDGGDTRSD